MKRRIRLTEGDLRRIVNRSVRRVLREAALNSEPPYYWSISEMRRSGVHDGERETYQCFEDSATSHDASQSEFDTPEEAYADGLKQLNFWELYTCCPIEYFETTINFCLQFNWVQEKWTNQSDSPICLPSPSDLL